MRAPPSEASPLRTSIIYSATEGLARAIYNHPFVRREPAVIRSAGAAAKVPLVTNDHHLLAHRAMTDLDVLTPGALLARMEETFLKRSADTSVRVLRGTWEQLEGSAGVSEANRQGK